MKRYGNGIATVSRQYRTKEKETETEKETREREKDGYARTRRRRKSETARGQLLSRASSTDRRSSPSSPVKGVPCVHDTRRAMHGGAA